MTNTNSFSQLEFSLLNSHQLSISLLTNRQQRKWRGRKGMTTITGWESEREMRKISGKNKPNTTEIMFCTTVNNGEMLGDISNIKVVLLLQHLRGIFNFISNECQCYLPQNEFWSGWWEGHSYILSCVGLFIIHTSDIIMFVSTCHVQYCVCCMSPFLRNWSVFCHVFHSDYSFYAASVNS